jgi:hypothetical protein
MISLRDGSIISAAPQRCLRRAAQSRRAREVWLCKPAAEPPLHPLAHVAATPIVVASTASHRHSARAFSIERMKSNE